MGLAPDGIGLAPRSLQVRATHGGHAVAERSQRAPSPSRAVLVGVVRFLRAATGRPSLHALPRTPNPRSWGGPLRTAATPGNSKSVPGGAILPLDSPVPATRPGL